MDSLVSHASPVVGLGPYGVPSLPVVPDRTTHPTRDNRYPAYTANMSDARLVTDYRPKCTKNVMAGQQFHTKRWMIEHATDLIQESRRRQVEWTGAALPMANTAPPPAGYVHSTPFESEYVPTHLKGGIGVERANSHAVPLFGTFQPTSTIAELQGNRKSIDGTRVYEGGRNSLRGRTAPNGS